MKLFFGLGNPGKTYQNTRHNLGQRVINKTVETYNSNLLKRANLSSEIFKDSDNIFAISTDYMNHSGISVQKIANYYKIDSQNIYIIHDDLDIEVGDWKIQFDRGSAGHNGIKSIIENLGTQAFHRIRVGIGKPRLDKASGDGGSINNIPVEDYVLQKFSIEEENVIKNTIDKVIVELNKIIEQ